MSIKQEIVLNYLDQFPLTPSLTLARLIYKENPTVFTDIENARTTIRNYRGTNGKDNRQTIKNRKHFGFKGKLNPFDTLPEGIKCYQDWVPFEIDGNKILVINDLHIPYHDKRAVITALEYGKKEGIDVIFINGDLDDFYPLSRFEKDPRKRDIQYEIDVTQEFFEILRDMFPKTKIYFKLGNHDERLERYLKVKAPELLGLDCLSIGNLLEVNRHKIEIVPDRRIAKVGYLHIVHAHEFGNGSGGVNPARWLYLKGKEIAMCGHFHRTSDHTEKSMADNVISCWSVACLCDLRPEYLPINNWNHGFAIINRLHGKCFEVLNKKIIDGKVY